MRQGALRRGRELVGLAVYTDERRAGPVGEVRDALLAPDGSVAALVVLPTRGFLRKEAILPVSSFRRISPEGALLNGPLVQRGAEPEAQGIRLYGGDDALCGKLLVSEDGETIGTIGDVVFEQGALRLWGFEVSDGILRDIFAGRPVVEAAGSFVDGERVILGARGGRHMNLTPGGHPSP